MIKSLLHFRVIKTVIASFIALVAARLMLASYPIFTALSACFCIRQTFITSFKHFIKEIKLATVATMLALLFGGILEFDYMVTQIPFMDFAATALAIGVVVAVAHYFDLFDALFIGVLTVAYILLVPAGSSYENVFLARGAARLGHILVGSIAALAIDFVFSGLEYKKLFHHRLKQVISSTHDMLELFVEAILFHSREKMDRMLDIMVDTQNLLNYVKDKLDDLATELSFRGGNIHGFDKTQLVTLQNILRDFRLISFQIESCGVNYIELINIRDTKGADDAIAENDYSKISAKGRKLSEIISCLKKAVETENPDLLIKIINCKIQPVGYKHFFENVKNDDIDDLKLMAIDTITSISRMEQHLCKASKLIHKYLSARQNPPKASPTKIIP